MEKFTFFWQDDSPFSQWYRCQFTVDEVKYNCAEQYMMAEKARFFKDNDTLKKVLASTSPV